MSEIRVGGRVSVSDDIEVRREAVRWFPNAGQMVTGEVVGIFQNGKVKVALDFGKVMHFMPADLKVCDQVALRHESEGAPII